MTLERGPFARGEPGFRLTRGLRQRKGSYANETAIAHWSGAWSKAMALAFNKVDYGTALGIPPPISSKFSIMMLQGIFAWAAQPAILFSRAVTRSPAIAM